MKKAQTQQVPTPRPLGFRPILGGLRPPWGLTAPGGFAPIGATPLYTLVFKPGQLSHWGSCHTGAVVYLDSCPTWAVVQPGQLSYLGSCLPGQLSPGQLSAWTVVTWAVVVAPEIYLAGSYKLINFGLHFCTDSASQENKKCKSNQRLDISTPHCPTNSYCTQKCVYPTTCDNL